MYIGMSSRKLRKLLCKDSPSAAVLMKLKHSSLQWSVQDSWTLHFVISF